MSKVKRKHMGGYANGRLVVGGAKALVEETIFETVGESENDIKSS